MIKKNIFNLELQNVDISSKIVVGLERVSEAYRVLLWEHAKVLGLSPIQIQILIFVSFHLDNLCTVSHLAKEFNLTKPTISDATKVLENKKLIKKHSSSVDKRAYYISLTTDGQCIVDSTKHFASPIGIIIEKFNEKEQEQLFSILSKLIFELSHEGILTVQRTCYSCRFYEKKKVKFFCHLLKQELLNKEIRLDCPEYEKNVGNIV